MVSGGVRLIRTVSFCRTSQCTDAAASYSCSKWCSQAMHASPQTYTSACCFVRFCKMRPKCAKSSCNISQRNSTHAQAACNDVALRVMRTCRLLCLPTSSLRCAVQMSVVSLFSVPCSRRCYSLYSNAIINGGLHTIRTPSNAITQATCMHTPTAVYTVPRAKCPKHNTLGLQARNHIHRPPLQHQPCDQSSREKTQADERRACPCRHVTTKEQHAVRVQVSHELVLRQGPSSQETICQARLLQWLLAASIRCLVRQLRSSLPVATTYGLDTKQCSNQACQKLLRISRWHAYCRRKVGQRTANVQCTHRPWHNSINNSYKNTHCLQHTMVDSGSTAAEQAFLHCASIQHTHSNAMHITST